MAKLYLVLGDQLSHELSSLRDLGPDDTVLMCEVHEEATYVKHHQMKIAFLFSAMRHFAEALRQRGHTVIYVPLDDANNTQSLKSEVKRRIQESSGAFSHLILTEPGEYRLKEDMQTWEADLKIPITIHADDRFFCAVDDFSSWAKSRRQLRLEHFYVWMRKKHDVLMHEGKPAGGQWNYDAANRKRLPEAVVVPKPTSFQPDTITESVLALVEKKFSSHFGRCRPFHFAVTREQALQVLDEFIEQRLSHFGDFQDAMSTDQPWLFHSHIGLYLNCGLLYPAEIIAAVEKAYVTGKAPINAAEGFIRQILGWREFIRGMYWLKMPAYAECNFFEAKRKLPKFFWDAKTRMHCVAQSIQQTHDYGYAHHIQRLMVLGNFATLVGLDPKEVQRWYLLVYVDAYEWVELPNVVGMALFADGGFFASKPYIASGNYINKMSNYCKSCSYKVTQKTGKDACPFNYLYWHFVKRHVDVLQTNQRMAFALKNLDRLSAEQLAAVEESARDFLESLDT